MAVTLQLEDRSVKTPRAMLEDILVKVDEFYYPIDFLVSDMESNGNPGQAKYLSFLEDPF